MSSEKRFVLGYNLSRSCLRLIFKECKTVAAGLVVLCLLSALPGFAQTTWTVSSLGDNAGDPTTLRGAIAAAAAGDTIDFSVTGTITLTGGPLVIAKNLAITGPGASNLTVSANNLFRVFVIDPITASLSGLTIANGFAPPGCCQVGRGAGIANGGTLTLIDTLVTNNFASDSGGGIVTGGTLILQNSTISSNSAVSNGGGIYNTGVAQLIDSIVSGNSAGSGSGLWNDFGTLTLTKSTVSSNSGDGIANGRTLTLIDSTVSNNSTNGIVNNGGTGTLTNSTVSNNLSDGIINHAAGALTLINGTISGNSRGINNNWGTLTINNSTVARNLRLGGLANGTFGILVAKNSLLANNSGGNCSLPGGTATSHGHNLSSDGSCASFFTQPGDLNNTPAGLDPAGLQNNGGPTQTIALIVGSAALDAIPAADCTDTAGNPILTDQRGVSRPQGTACDVGAFELGPTDPVGPITSNVLGDPNPASVNQSIALSANIDDTTTGGATISLADFEVRDGDGNVVHSGTGDNDACPSPQNLCPVDEFGNPELSPAFDAVMENVEVTIPAGTLTPGVYNACVRGTDANGNTGEFECAYLVLYDPSGGFVTGGGWIQSDPGFCLLNTLCASAWGKANFGFVSKYKKGATVPTGETEFQFKAGGLNFHGAEYEWLVVSGPMAQYKGSGTINGAGQYGFLLTAQDSAISGGPAQDTFRIKIWDKATETTVYDNSSNQPIGGGSIVIHKK